MTENENLSAQSPALAEQVFGPQPPELNEDDFDAQYKPMDNPEGSVLWEREQILPLMDAGTVTDNNVWSVVDTDDGGTAAIAGWHIVDVFAYMVTEVPWVDGREGMVFDDTSCGGDCDENRCPACPAPEVSA